MSGANGLNLRRVDYEASVGNNLQLGLDAIGVVSGLPGVGELLATPDTLQRPQSYRVIGDSGAKSGHSLFQ